MQKSTESSPKRKNKYQFIESLLEISKRNLLLFDPYSPLTYQLKLTVLPGSSVLVKIVVESADGLPNYFQVSPPMISFDNTNFDNFRSITIFNDLNTSQRDLFRLGEQYFIRHILVSPEEHFHNLQETINLYCIKPTGPNVKVCGKDDCFQLGTYESIYRYKAYRDLATIELPKPIKAKVPKLENIFYSEEMQGIKFIQVDCGRQHGGGVTDDGDVYIWGMGNFGQLGMDPKEIHQYQEAYLKESIRYVEYDFNKNKASDEDYVNEQQGYAPILHLPTHLKTKYIVVSIACGDFHTLLLDSKGKVYSFGSHENGRLGLRSISSHVIYPKQVDIEEFVRRIGCCAASSLVLTTEGRVYSWGSQKYGTLGQGISNDLWAPCLIKTLQSIHSIFTGPTTSACLDYDHKLYIWGAFYKNSIATPKRFDRFRSLDEHHMKIRHVALGENHYGIITDDLNVYTWGSNEFGQLGYGTEIESQDNPKLVTALSGMGIYHISFGAGHSLAVSLQGFLYVWGHNQRNQLSLHTYTAQNVAFMEKQTTDNKEKAVKLPKLCEDMLGEPILFAVAKNDSTMCITSPSLLDPEGDNEYWKKWKDEVIRKENQIVYSELKKASQFKETKRSFSMEIIETARQRSVEKLKKMEEAYGHVSPYNSPRNMQLLESNLGIDYFDTNKSNYVFYHFLGYQRSTLYGVNSTQKDVELASNEARVVMEKSPQLKALDEEVLEYNALNYSNFGVIFNSTVHRRGKKKLGQLLEDSEFDQVLTFLDSKQKKNPYNMDL